MARPYDNCPSGTTNAVFSYTVHTDNRHADHSGLQFRNHAKQILSGNNQSGARSALFDMVDNPGLWYCVLLDTEGKSYNSTAPAINDFYNIDDHSCGAALAGWYSHRKAESNIWVYPFAGSTGFRNLLDGPTITAYFCPISDNVR